VAEPLRVGVIGVGVMGSHHARVYDELPGARLVAVADADETRLAGDRWGASVRAYEDYRTMLAEESLDAVSIVVPTRLHLEVALACIERGVPLLVEKPLAADLDECLQLKEASENAGVPLMAGHIERYNPVIVAARQLIMDGRLGRVHEARMQRIGPFFERMRDVGVVHDLATHDIDLLRVLFNCDVERVSAEIQSGVRTSYEDSLSAVLRMTNGVVASLEVNWLSPSKFRGFSFLSEHGTLIGDFIPQTLTLGHSTGESEDIPVQQSEPLRAELEAFLSVARGDDPPPITADDAIAAMRVVEALIESAKRGIALPVAGFS
jgi:predicted dehydrogenase